MCWLRCLGHTNDVLENTNESCRARDPVRPYLIWEDDGCAVCSSRKGTPTLSSALQNSSSHRRRLVGHALLASRRRCSAGGPQAAGVLGTDSLLPIQMLDSDHDSTVGFLVTVIIVYGWKRG